MEGGVLIVPDRPEMDVGPASAPYLGPQPIVLKDSDKVLEGFTTQVGYWSSEGENVDVKEDHSARVIQVAWHAFAERKWRTIMAALERDSSNLIIKVDDDDYTAEHKELRALYHGGELL